MPPVWGRLRCLITGHRSTGLFLWWMCDNCKDTCPPSTTKNNRGMTDTRWKDAAVSELRCTCCKEPRMIVKPDGSEWMHVNDETAAEVRHIHGDWSSSDCDGQMVGSDVKRVWSLNWDYIDPRKVAIGGTPPTFDDLWRHMVASAVPAHADHCTVEICGGDTINVHESTEEGGRSTRMYVCDDPWCAFDEREVRDLQAEAAGY